MRLSSRWLGIVCSVWGLACGAAETASLAPEPVSKAKRKPWESKETGALPPSIHTELDQHAVCKRSPYCPLHGVFPPKVAPKGDAPAVIWSQDLEKPGKLDLGPHGGLDLYGVVMSGEVRLSAEAFGDKARVLRPWHAFRAPAVGVRLEAAKKRARLALALVTRSRRPVAPVIAAELRRPGGHWATARPGPLRVIDFTKRDDLAWAKGAAHARIGFEDGSASMQLLRMDPKVPMPPHVHPKSWEVIALFEVDGELKLDDGRGRKNDFAKRAGTLIEDGRVVRIPDGVRHAFSPAGRKRSFGLQLYVPPGPEQRFKDLAAGR